MPPTNPQNEPTLEESMTEVMKTLPPLVRKFLADGMHSVAAKRLMNKYSLRVDQAGVLERELMLLLMGIESSEDFIEALFGEAGIEEETVKSILTDINDEVFKSLQGEMREPNAPVIKAPSSQTPAVSAIPRTPRPAPPRVDHPPLVPPPTLIPEPPPAQAPRPVQATSAPPVAQPRAFVGAPETRPGVRNLIPNPPQTRPNVPPAPPIVAPTSSSTQPQAPRPTPPAAMRPPAPPPENLPGAMPPPASPQKPIAPVQQPAPAIPPTPQPPPIIKGYAADPYREPIE